MAVEASKYQVSPGTEEVVLDLQAFMEKVHSDLQAFMEKVHSDLQAFMEKVHSDFSHRGFCTKDPFSLMTNNPDWRR